MALESTIRDQFLRLWETFAAGNFAYGKIEAYETQEDEWVAALAWASDAAIERAASQFIRGTSKLPTLAEFIGLVRSHIAQAPAPDEGPELTDDELTARREWVSQVVDSLVGYFSDPNDARGHWHGGPDPCSVCWGDPEPFILPPLPPKVGSREQLFDCSCGEGRGWVEVSPRIVRPCEFCRPGQYAKWIDGAYA